MRFPALLFALLAGNAMAVDEIAIRNAWIREAPPVAAVQAAYFSACNNGESSVTLIGVESAAFGRIEMHETLETETTSRMARLDSVSIAPGDCVEFDRGGKHLMLFDAARRFAAGDRVELTLVFDTQRIRIDFPVHRGTVQGDDDPSDDHKHHHGH